MTFQPLPYLMLYLSLSITLFFLKPLCDLCCFVLFTSLSFSAHTFKFQDVSERVQDRRGAWERVDEIWGDDFASHNELGSQLWQEEGRMGGAAGHT